MADETRPTCPHLTRRHLMVGAVGVGSAGVLAACGGGGAPASSTEATGSAPASESPSDSGSSSGAGGGDTVPVSQVPVEGGAVVEAADGPVVLTQPASGEFKAFTAVCTHAGCTVGSVEANEIVCPCHGSRFSARDGSNVQGPGGSTANLAPLAEVPLTVDGDSLVLG